MRRTRITFCLLAVAFGCLSPSAPGQPSPTVVTDITCTVTSAEGTGKTRTVTIDRGRADGLVAGWRGRAYVTYRREPRREFKAVGRAEARSLDDRSATVTVTLNDPASDFGKGDAVELPASVPAGAGRSALWELATRGIVLVDNSGRAINDFRALLADDSPATESAAIETMRRAIMEVAEFVQGEAIDAPRKSGRYAGRRASEVIGAVTRADIEAFLAFVTSFPGNYIGHRWKVSETFATWVINNGPVSTDELRDRLVAAQNRAERQAIIRANRTAILADGMMVHWQSDAQRWADDGRHAQAHALATAVIEAAELLKRPGDLGWGYFARGYAFAEQLRQREGAEWYGRAAAVFRSVKPRTEDSIKGESFSLHNRAIRYESLGRLPEALEGYRAALALKGAFKATPASLANSYQAIGDILHKKGDYAGALAMLDRCAALRATLDDTVQYNWTLSRRALTLSKLGRVAEADRSFGGILAAYVKEGNPKGEADARVSFASHLWRLGRYPEALPEYEKAAALRELMGDRAGLVTALNGVGRLQWNLGKYDLSLAAHQRALSLARDLRDRAAEATALREIGDLRKRSGDVPAALKDYANAQGIRHGLGDSLGEAELVEQIGHIRTERKEYPQALDAFRRAAGAFEKAGAKADLARCRHNVGVALENMGDLDGALAQYEQALAMRRAIGARDDQVTTLLNMSMAQWRRRELRQALRLIAEAERLAAGQSALLRATALRRKGELLAASFQHASAVQCLRKALALFGSPSVADRGEEAGTLVKLAYAYDVQGKRAEALEAYRKALTIAEAMPDRATACAALQGIGWVHRSFGESAQALDAQRRALELARQTGDPVRVAESLYALSAVRMDRGDYREAQAALDESVQLYRTAGNEYGLMMAENARGAVAYRQGDLDASRAHLERSLALARRLQSRSDLAYAMMNLGELCSQQGRFKEAAQMLAGAVDAAAATHAPDLLAAVRTTLARTRREWAESLAKARRAPEAAKLLASSVGPLSQAIAAYRSLGAKGSIAEALTEMGAVQIGLRLHADATKSLAEAATIAEAIQARHVIWETYWAQARLAEARGDLPGAVALMRKAVAVVDELKQGIAGGEEGMAKFLLSKVRLCEAMADMLGRLGGREKDVAARRRIAEEALQYVGLARFQILARASSAGGDDGGAAQAYRESLARQGRLEQTRSSALAAGNRQRATQLAEALARNDEDLAANYVKVVQADPDFAARLKFDPRRLLDAAAALPDKAALLICFAGAEQLHLWVFDKTGVRVWKRLDARREDVYSLVREFREGVNQMKERVVRRERLGEGFGKAAEADTRNPEWYRDSIKRMRAALGSLHDLLISPIEKEIGGAETLAVLPYGQLCYLPFEALYDELTGRFLAESRRIAYLTSESHVEATLRLLQEPARGGADCWVAFADPRGRLGSALEEAREIADLFPASEIHSAASGTATKLAVYGLRPDCTILHFATHGRLNSADPNQTYLELGVPPDGPKPVDIVVDGKTFTVQSDGALTQLEVYPRLRKTVEAFRERKVHLVTLSACETARAQDAPEAEVLGMPDAFALAGASAVLASLWSVETYSTTDLMVEFYRLYSKERLGKGDSLAQARRTLITSDNGRYAHPFYWAPFVLYGDWR